MIDITAFKKMQEPRLNQPRLRLFINNQLYKTKRLMELKLTEANGKQQTTLDIRLSDHDGKISLPKPVANEPMTVSLFLGNVRKLYYKGEFQVTEIEYNGRSDESVDSVLIKSEPVNRVQSLDLEKPIKEKHNLADLIQEITKEIRLKLEGDSEKLLKEYELKAKNSIESQNSTVQTPTNYSIVPEPINLNTQSQEGQTNQEIKIIKDEEEYGIPDYKNTSVLEFLTSLAEKIGMSFYIKPLDLKPEEIGREWDEAVKNYLENSLISIFKSPTESYAHVGEKFKNYLVFKKKYEYEEDKNKLLKIGSKFVNFHSKNAETHSINRSECTEYTHSYKPDQQCYTQVVVNYKDETGTKEVNIDVFDEKNDDDENENIYISHIDGKDFHHAEEIAKNIKDQIIQLKSYITITLVIGNPDIKPGDRVEIKGSNLRTSYSTIGLNNKKTDEWMVQEVIHNVNAEIGLNTTLTMHEIIKEEITTPLSLDDININL